MLGWKDLYKKEETFPNSLPELSNGCKVMGLRFPCLYFHIRGRSIRDKVSRLFLCAAFAARNLYQ